ncbi:hypothetical protein GCM10027203_45310 [Nonomuraea fastidiosa]
MSSLSHLALTDSDRVYPLQVACKRVTFRGSSMETENAPKATAQWRVEED